MPIDLHTPNQNSDTQPSSPIGDIKKNIDKQKQEFVEQAKKNPQLMELLEEIQSFWSKYGFKIKLILIGILILTIVVIGIRVGSNVAGLFRPSPATPPEIPNITPTQESITQTELQRLKEEIKEFETLLPDPAPPPVDENIYIQTDPSKELDN